MKLLLLASLGGAIGAAARYLVNLAFAGPQIVRGALVFPWATFTVNIAGGLLMGFLSILIVERLGASPEWRVFLLTGILGGFTTFSAYSLDMMNLYSDGGVSLSLTKALVEANRAKFQIKTGGRSGTLIEVVFPHAVAKV